MQMLGGVFGGSVALRGNLNSLFQDCSGTVIGLGLVLTAGHCFPVLGDRTATRFVDVWVNGSRVQYTGGATWTWNVAQGSGPLYQRSNDPQTGRRASLPFDSSVAFGKVSAVVRLDHAFGPDLAVALFDWELGRTGFGSTIAPLAAIGQSLDTIDFSPAIAGAGSFVFGVAVGHSNSLSSDPIRKTDDRLRLGSPIYLDTSPVVLDAHGQGAQHTYYVQKESRVKTLLDTNLNPHGSVAPPTYLQARHQSGRLIGGDSGGGLFSFTSTGPVLLGVAAAVNASDEIWTSVAHYRSDITDAIQLLQNLDAVPPGSDPVRPLLPASAQDVSVYRRVSTFTDLAPGATNWIALGEMPGSIGQSIQVTGGLIQSLDFDPAMLPFLGFYGDEAMTQPLGVTFAEGVATLTTPVGFVFVKGELLPDAFTTTVIGIEIVELPGTNVQRALHDGLGGLELSVTALLPVPEATTLTMFALGLCGLALRMRRRPR
jgi:hypothetical protein